MTTLELIPPLLTPLLESDAVDRDNLSRSVNRAFDNGATGVFVLGSTGEGPLLSASQRQEVVETVAATMKGRGSLFVGVSDTSLRRVREVIAELNVPGVTHFVLTPPYYGDFSDPESQREFFSAIAEESPIPIILYNIPPAVHVTLGLEVVAGLAGHPNVAAVKDSGGDMQYFRGLLKIAEEADLRVYQGAERLAGLSLLAGASGLVVGSANLSCRPFAEMLKAMLRDDRSGVLECQSRVDKMYAVNGQGPWLSCLKAAADMLGFCGDTISAPWPRLLDEQREAVRRALIESQLLHND